MGGSVRGRSSGRWSLCRCIIKVRYICRNLIIHFGDVVFLAPSVVRGGCSPVGGGIVGLGIVGIVVGGRVVVGRVGLGLAVLVSRVGVVGGHESWVDIRFACRKYIINLSDGVHNVGFVLGCLQGTEVGHQLGRGLVRIEGLGSCEDLVSCTSL